MNKKSILPAVLIAYLVLLFVPVNMFLFFPGLFQKIPFLSSLPPAPSSQSEDVVSDINNTSVFSKDALSKNELLSINRADAGSQEFKELYSSVNDDERKFGYFKSLEGDTLTLSSRDTDGELLTFVVDAHTLLMCSKSTPVGVLENGDDAYLWDSYNTGFREESILSSLITLSDSVPFTYKLDILSSYGDNRPLHYSDVPVGESLKWINIFPNYCGMLNSGLFN